MSIRKVPETARADQSCHLMQGRAAVVDRAAQPPDPDREQAVEREDDRGVPEREEEADRERALAVGHQLARGVVDRADVIGVEGVAQPERVGGDPHSEPEDRAAAQPRSSGDDDREQDPEADHVQPEDHGGHPAGPAPLGGVIEPLMRAQRDVPSARSAARMLILRERHSPAIGKCVNRAS